MAAGLAASAVHFAFMIVKSQAGLFPSFQPYEDLQRALNGLVGGAVPPAVPWLLSFANGTMVLGFVFARGYRLIPGRSGIMKGLVFGLAGWLLMGLAFFPLLGQGVFAVAAGHGVLPALYALAMVLSYAVVLGAVYAALNPADERPPSP